MGRSLLRVPSTRAHQAQSTSRLGILACPRSITGITKPNLAAELECEMFVMLAANVCWNGAPLVFRGLHGGTNRRCICAMLRHLLGV